MHGVPGATRKEGCWEAARTVGQLGQAGAPGLGQAADVELALALVADDHGALAKAAAQEVRAGAQHAAALARRLARHCDQLRLHLPPAAPALAAE